MKNIIEIEVKDTVDELISDLHYDFETKSGEATLMQAYRLEQIKKDLTELLFEQINQNL